LIPALVFHSSIVASQSFHRYTYVELLSKRSYFHKVHKEPRSFTERLFNFKNSLCESLCLLSVYLWHKKSSKSNQAI